MANHTKFTFVAAAGILLLPLAFSSAQSATVAESRCLANGKSKVQCACIAALGIGTTQALKQFIKNHGRTKTSCNARAVTLGLKIPAKPTSTLVTKVKNNKGIGNCDEGGCSGAPRIDGDNPGQAKNFGGSGSGLGGGAGSSSGGGGGGSSSSGGGGSNGGGNGNNK